MPQSGMHIAVPVDAAALQAQTEQANQALAQIQGLEVTAATLQGVTDFLRGICQAKDALEAQRKQITQPINAGLKAVNGLFKPAAEALEALERAIKQKLAAYQLAAKQEQDRQFAAAAEAANRGDQQALTVALQASTAAAPAKPQGVTTRHVWVPTIVAPDLVPREYCIPSIVALRAAAQGLNEADQPPAVPGVTWALEAVVGVRR